MADNSLSKDPVQGFIDEMKAPPSGGYKASIDTIASQSRVPANFLMAFSEMAPAKDDASRAKAAQMIADKIAPRIRAGEKIEDIVQSISGDNKEAAQKFIERAYQIADEHYAPPEAPKEEPGLIDDLGTQAKATAQSIAGSVIKGVGIAAEEMASGGRYQGAPTKVRDAASKVGDTFSAASDATRATLSKETLDAVEGSTPDGDLFKPSTWTVGKNPSLRGYSFLAMDVLGSLLPVVATAVVTRSPTATAAVGGIMGGGDAASTARQIIMEAAKTIGPDGKSVLEHGSPYYRAMLEAGRTPEEALDLTAAASEKTAFLMTAPVSAFGGAATQKIIAPAEGALVKGGPIARILGTAALSGLEEGVQEASETIAARYGTERASGMDLDLTNGTFGDFILGALGGAIPGAISGATHRDDKEAPLGLPAPDQPLPPDQPLALPAPRLALPAPDGAAPAAPAKPRPFKAALDAAPDQILPGVTGPVTVRAGDLPPFVGTIHKDNGILLTIADENGEVIEISRDQLESGEATVETAAPTVSDLNAPPETPSEAAQDGIVAPRGSIPGAVTPDEARRRMGVLEDQARAQGWTKRRLAKKQELEAIIASDQSGQAAPLAPDASPSDTQTSTPPLAELDGEAPRARFVGQFEQPAEDSKDAVTVSVTDKGPWNFNDTWPAPDAEKVAAREAEGRIEFDNTTDDAQSVVGILTETLGELTAEMGFARQWEAEVQKIKAGQKASFRVKKGEDPLQIAEANLTEAKRNIDGIDGALRDVWSDEAVDAMGAQIAKTLDRETRAPDQAPVAPSDTVAPQAKEQALPVSGSASDSGQSGTRQGLSVTDEPAARRLNVKTTGPELGGMQTELTAAAETKPSEPDKEEGGNPDPRANAKQIAARSEPEGTKKQPSGSTPSSGPYRLDQSLTPQHRKALAKFRDTDGGELVGQIDEALRRAADERRRKGASEQMDLLIAEGEKVAKDVIADLRKKQGVIDFPSRDEDTGEWEMDGSPASEALLWLDTFEAQGVSIDASDHADGDGAARAPGEIDQMPADEVFPPVANPVNLDKAAKETGEISMDEAATRLAEWKKTAAEIGKSGVNSDKIIVSLFDYTGAWSQPWVDAGYQVLRFDVKTGSDILTDDFFWNRLTEIREEGKEVYGLLSACPCTTFAGSGARWWADLHDKESPEALAKVFGSRAATSGAKSALEYNLMLVKATRDAIALAKPTGFHVLENPIGRIETAAGMPKPRARFHPYNFGDPYTKYTQLFGDFSTDLPFANVDPVEGSKVQSKHRGDDPLGKEARSTTPEGFAYAFFMGNDPTALKRAAQPSGAKAAAASWSPRTPKSEAVMPKTQTDLFGGAEKSADEMAFADRRKREWGAFLAIAEGGRSTWEGDLEAATAYVNKNRVTLTTAEGSRTVDTEGMTRGDIVGWARWAMQQIHGFAEKPAPKEVETAVPSAQEVKAAAKEADRNPTEAQKDDGRKMSSFAPSSEDRASSYAKVFGDSPEAQALRSKGFDALPRDGRAVILSHVISATDDPKVFETIIKAVPVDVMDGLGGTKRATQRLLRDVAMLARRLAIPRDVAIPEAVVAFVDALSASIKRAPALPTAEESGLGGGPVSAELSNNGDAAVEARGRDVRHHAIAGQAVSIDHSPTAGQKEAGNYLKGSIAWRGLDITIENAKGSIRRGKDRNGEQWSVKMPAHYGYIRRSEGADGDHVDIYMGDHPESDFVLIVDQKDISTGKFDEHKVMLGFMDEASARTAYEDGFSDGKGAERYAAGTKVDVETLKAWIEDGDTKMPASSARGQAAFVLRNTQKKLAEAASEEKRLEVDAAEKSAAKRKAEQSEEVPPAPTKIEDFGEKIEGAAKERWKTFIARLDAVPDRDIVYEPLSTTFPEPNYQALIDEGADPWAVAFVRAARDAIPNKPRSSWKLNGWVEAVTALRELARSAMSGDMNVQQIKHRLIMKPNSIRSDILNTVELYQAVGHERSLKGISLHQHQYSLRNGKEYSPPLAVWEVSRAQAATAFSNMPRVLAEGETAEKAIEAFKASYQKNTDAETAAHRKGAKFIIYVPRRRDTEKPYIVGTKIGRDYIGLASFASVTEARKEITENNAALQSKLDRLKTVPKERRAENMPRVGADHRAGADATPEAFQEAFGFRGVQFGNYVESARRQEDLNEAFDALHDLAGILDVDPRALSLNGQLGLAFGARGKGGKNAAAAHYETDQVVINLTKTNGAGSLAHEWFHSLDNYFERARGSKLGFITNRPKPIADVETDVRPEVLTAFSDLHAAVKKTAIEARSRELDKYRSSPYWATGIEMLARSFESYVIAKLQDQNAANDYLANIVDEAVFEAEAKLYGQEHSTYPYPVASEVPVIRAAFDNLFRTIETRETEAGVEMYMADYRLKGDMSRITAQIHQLLRDKKLSEPIALTKSPDVLRALWKKNVPVVIANRVIWKANAEKHGLTEKQIVSAVEGLLDPVMVFDSATSNDSLVALVDVRGEDRPVVVALQYNERIGQIEVSRVASIHAKDRAGTIGQWMRDGLLRYRNKRKADAWSWSRGLQLPNDAQATHRRGLKILQHRDVFKPTELRGWDMIDADDSISDEQIAQISTAIEAEMKAHGLSGRIPVKVVRDLYSRTTGKSVQGLFRREDQEIHIRAGAEAGEMGVLHHEIIHALRDARLWGKERPFGLFTEAEWRALIVAANRQSGLFERMKALYPHLDEGARSEEMVAELYRLWQAKQAQVGRADRVLTKLRNFFEALANGLSGQGFVSAERIMRQIARGDVGNRAQARGEDGRFVSAAEAAMASMPDFGFARTDEDLDAKERGIIGHLLTSAMNGKNGVNLLSLVPGRPLFAELGKKIPSALQYLRNKEEMDAMRNDWHEKTDKIAQAWRKLIAKNGKANVEMMDLMHKATIAGVDPSRPFERRTDNLMRKAREYVSRHGADAPEWAQSMVAEENGRFDAHRALKQIFDRLPDEFREMFVRVRRSYQALGDVFEKTVLDNAQKAMKFNEKRAKQQFEDDMRAIDDEGLTGEERQTRVDAATKKRDEAEKRAAWNRGARLSGLRAKFESNRLSGPYFPLARFGNFFVTVRDSDGQVISFSKHETERNQAVEAKRWKGQEGITVQTGVLSEPGAARKQVDPTFVADIEDMLGDAGASDDVMDAIWQRWLDTLPDMSVRRSRMHRKGTPGYDTDAFRAFGRQMFHGSHQLARLTYAQDMQMNLDDARREAANADDPNRAGLIVNEMERRHEYTMNPAGSAWAQMATSAAFFYYLAVTPAAAIVNLSQTSIVGIPILSSGFRNASVGSAAVALTKAARDFIGGRGDASKGPRLSDDERSAMKEAYRRGTIDKTQSHDLAGVAEQGVGPRYSTDTKYFGIIPAGILKDASIRHKWMGYISWFFHHAERMNREVTFLAAYRMARENGFDHQRGIEKAADLTWKTHFDYQNCVDDKTEILTVDGWKKWDGLDVGDRIISTDDAGRAVEIGVQEVNVFHRPQEIALFSAKPRRNFSMAVTDDHKCVVMKQTKVGGERVWTNPYFELAGNLDQRHHILRAPLAPLQRPGSIGVDMAALIGWFVAEGWLAKNRGAKAANNTRIEQSLAHNPEHVAEIDGLLARLGARFSRHIVKDGRHVLWSITGDMSERLRQFCPGMNLTWELFATLSAAEMEALISAFAKGDGTIRGKNGCITISQKATKNRQNLEVLQAMATAIGRTASLGAGNTRDSAHLILAGNGRVKTQKTAVGKLEVGRVAVPMVWCPTTDNGRWIARRSGCVFVTGNTARPRLLQNDYTKVLMTFRNFQINMLWRLFRDAHQALKGATPEDRAEARGQLGGITLMLFAHAGITGTWGYALTMALLGMFADDGDDDVEQALQTQLVNLFGPNIAGMLLKGVPGHLTGINLTSRVGMPELWFRSSDRNLEGDDVYNYWLTQMIGPVPGMAENVFRGVQKIGEGEVWRGIETAAPKFVRDPLKALRYMEDGVNTYSGNPILDDVNVGDAIKQALGFTPARIAEAYDVNTKLRNREQRILDERSRILGEAAQEARDGGISEGTMDRVQAFNEANPDYPITSKTIRTSLKSRLRAANDTSGGIRLNSKLDRRLREEAAPRIYQ